MCILRPDFRDGTKTVSAMIKTKTVTSKTKTKIVPARPRQYQDTEKYGLETRLCRETSVTLIGDDVEFLLIENKMIS